MVSSGEGVINQIITILPNQIRSNWNYQLGREVLQIKRVLEIIGKSLFTRNLKECKSNLKEKETESSATLLDHASLQFTFLCIFCCFCHFFQVRPLVGKDKDEDDAGIIYFVCVTFPESGHWAAIPSHYPHHSANLAPTISFLSHSPILLQGI